MKTKSRIDYQCAPYGRITRIPAGTPCRPASNLPQGGYWVDPWPRMSRAARQWAESYGFLVSESEVNP